MNVLVVAPEYPPKVIGGGGPVYARIAKRYASSGVVLPLLQLAATYAVPNIPLWLPGADVRRKHV